MTKLKNFFYRNLEKFFTLSTLLTITSALILKFLQVGRIDLSLSAEQRTNAIVLTLFILVVLIIIYKGMVDYCVSPEETKFIKFVSLLLYKLIVGILGLTIVGILMLIGTCLMVTTPFVNTVGIFSLWKIYWTDPQLMDYCTTEIKKTKLSFSKIDITKIIEKSNHNLETCKNLLKTAVEEAQIDEKITTASSWSKWILEFSTPFWWMIAITIIGGIGLCCFYYTTKTPDLTVLETQSESQINADDITADKIVTYIGELANKNNATQISTLSHETLNKTAILTGEIVLKHEGHIRRIEKDITQFFEVLRLLRSNNTNMFLQEQIKLKQIEKTFENSFTVLAETTQLIAESSLTGQLSPEQVANISKKLSALCLKVAPIKTEIKINE